MKFKKLRKTIAIAMMAIVLISSKSAVADSSYKGENYWTNIDIKAIQEIFSSKLYGDDSITSDPIKWMTNRETYVLIKDEGKGERSFWFNTPNLQQILYNKVTVMEPYGYQGNTINAYENNNKKILKITELKKPDEAKTGAQKWGYHIPSPTYVGEQPRITMSISGVLMESNWVKTAIKKISAFFGGDVLSPPEAEDINTLEYISPNDYMVNDRTFEKWLNDNWQKIVKSGKIPDNQVMVSKDAGVDDDGKDSEGNQYVWSNIVNSDTGLDSMTSGKEVNKTLKDYLGKKYNSFASNLVYLAVKNGAAEGFNNVPVRQMPYERETITDTDQASLTVEDPRIPKGVDIFGVFHIDSNMWHVFSNGVATFFLDLMGTIAEWTSVINSMISFSFMENAGINVPQLWNSDIVKIIITLSFIGFLIMIVRTLRKYLANGEGLARHISKFFIGLIALSYGAWLLINPLSFYNSIKSIGNSIMSMESSVVMNADSSVSDLIGRGTAEEKQAATYWVPYYSLWVNYNTNHILSEDKIDTKNSKKEPEQKDMTMPKLGGKDIKLWSAVAADAWTGGSGNHDDALRMVDHYMAPRMQDLNENNNPMFTMKTNENYNGQIQSSISVSIIISIFVLLLAVLIKAALFFEAMYELVLLPIYLVSTSIDEKEFIRQILRVFVGFVRVPAWGLLTSMILVNSTTSPGWDGLLALVFMIAIIFFLIKKIALSNSIFKPRFLKFMERHIPYLTSQNRGNIID